MGTDRPPDVQHFPPSHPEPEPREETIQRAVEEVEAVQRVHPEVEPADPTTRRGTNRVVWKSLAILGGIGFVIGAVVGLILSFVQGPFELVGRGNVEGSTDAVQVFLYALVLGAAFALVFAVIGTLIVLAREDGRIERETEEKTGRRPPPPASPRGEPR